MRCSLVVLLLVAVFVPLLNPTGVQAADPIGKVVEIKGAAWAESPAGRRELKLDGQVFKAETLSTDKGALLEVKFTDDSTLNLKELSRVALSEYSLDTNPSLCKQAFKFLRGALNMVTGKIVTRNSNQFKVETPLAVLGVRGTEFFVQQTSSGEENIGVTAMDKPHTVEVKTAKASLLIAEAGYFTRVALDGTLSPLSRIPQQMMQNISRSQSRATQLRVTPRR
jgi:hypothetical protein